MGSNSRRAFIFTYGCQMNVYESAVMKRILQRRGYLLADSPDEADLVILNTCSVRNRPERKVFGRLAELSKAKASRPQMRIVVSGCMAQLRATELRRRFPLDGIFGPRNLGEFEAFLEREEQGREQQVIATCLESHPFVGTTPAVEPGSASAFVSIMEGCSNFCSYCIVPYVRGPELTRPMEDVVGEITALVAEGVKEVTLLGQNVNAYGRDIVAQGPSSKKTGPPSRWADFSPAQRPADLKVCATQSIAHRAKAGNSSR
jgi:tRNA-2-methylthio-N6-dimethylallyladenosine synthase